MQSGNSQSSLEVLYHVSRDLADEIELRPLLKRILTQAVPNVGAERGSIVILNDQSIPIDAAIIYGDKIYSHTLTQIKETIDKGMAGWVIRHHKAVMVNDTREDQRWVRRPDDETTKTGSKSALCVPLVAHQKLVGVLTVVHPEVDYFNSEHLGLLQSISDIAGLAILNARLYAESQQRARVMSALIDNAVVLNSSLQLDDVLKHLLEQTVQALRVEVAGLAFLSIDSKELVFREVWGENSQFLKDVRIPFGKGITGKAASSGKIIIGLNNELEEIDQVQGFEIRGMAAAPVTTVGKLIGVLVVINPKGEQFNSDAGTILHAIGSLAGTAINNAQNYEELHATNTRYTELFDNHIDPILITDLTGQIIEANQQACSCLHYTKEQILNLHISKLHGMNHQKLGEDFILLPATGMVTYESEMYSQNSWETPVQVCVRRVTFSGIESIQWVLRDISERIDLDSLRNDLIAMIYHDLRSPLANVTASLDILNSLTTGDRDDTTVNLLNIAMRSSDRIQRLLNSLLDIYRLEAGQNIVNRKEADAATLIAEAMDILQSSLEVKNQVLSSHITADLPPVWVDSDMIRRVLVNLVENATKFSPVEAKIEVGVERKGEELLFWVKDNGPGISPDDQERIFDKFSRLKMAGATKGMGLGLAFCRLAVSGHGGRIWVDSKLEQGSTFYFTLPVKIIA